MMTAIGLGIVGLILIILLGWRLMLLQKRFQTALGDAEAGNLEQQLVDNFKELGRVQQDLEHLTQEYAKLATAQSLSSQKISIVRFNPFADTGGDQSFSLAVLDAHDSGYVLTSIHGRQGTRVYVKPIDFGKSKHQLSVEEQQVLQQAQKRTANK